MTISTSDLDNATESAESNIAEPTVHPLAASFPLLEGEQLEALVEDIRSRGQRDPIVLDQAGQLVDGRNRLRACQLAGVEPKFITLELDDPIAYIVSANLHRRHLTKGQQAMAYAMAYPEATEKGGRGKTAVLDTPVSSEYITKARFVLRHAPDLAAQVMLADGLGPSLTEAYKLAAEQKRAHEEYERLRSDVRERVDSLLEVCTRLRSHTDTPSAFVGQDDFVRAVRADVEQLITDAKQLADSV